MCVWTMICANVFQNQIVVGSYVCTNRLNIRRIRIGRHNRSKNVLQQRRVHGFKKAFGVPVLSKDQLTNHERIQYVVTHSARHYDVNVFACVVGIENCGNYLSPAVGSQVDTFDLCLNCVSSLLICITFYTTLIKRFRSIGYLIQTNNYMLTVW